MNLKTASSGIKGLDKNSISHKFNNEGFLDIYEKYFSPIRLEVQSIIEIGVRQGASLRLWHKYFPNACVAGIDINPECLKEADVKNNVDVIIGSQSDPDVIKKIVFYLRDKLLDGVDVIIDDGSHVNTSTLATFSNLFPLLKPGGLYCIEDTHVSYLDLRGHVDKWFGNNYMDKKGIIERGENKRELIDIFINNKIHELDNNKGEIKSIHFHSKLIVIEKIR